VDQGAGIGVFQHPQRAIGGLFHIADALAHIPALGGFGAAMAIKDDAVERPSPHAADEAVAVPLRPISNPLGVEFRERAPPGGWGSVARVEIRGKFLGGGAPVGVAPRRVPGQRPQLHRYLPDIRSPSAGTIPAMFDSKGQNNEGACTFCTYSLRMRRLVPDLMALQRNGSRGE
jgi:hypothetical protein